MGIRSSEEDAFYRPTETGCMKADADGTLRPAGVVQREWTREPYAAWARSWKEEADAQGRGDAMLFAVNCGANGLRLGSGTDAGVRVRSAADILRETAGQRAARAVQRLEGLCRSRWDLPDCAFTADMVGRVWALECMAADVAELLELVEAYSEPRPRGLQRVRDAYEAICKRHGFHGRFPADAFGRDVLDAAREAVAEAAWTLRALKVRHRLGLDPMSPKTVRGQQAVRAELQARPRLAGGALRRLFAALLPRGWDGRKGGER